MRNSGFQYIEAGDTSTVVLETHDFYGQVLNGAGPFSISRCDHVYAEILSS